MDFRVILECEIIDLQMELLALDEYYKNRKKELKYQIKKREKKIKSMSENNC